MRLLWSLQIYDCWEHLVGSSFFIVCYGLKVLTDESGKCIRPCFWLIAGLCCVHLWSFVWKWVIYDVVCIFAVVIAGNSEPMLSNSFVLNSDLLGQNMEQIEVFSCLSSLLLSKYLKSRTSDHAIGLLKWFWSIALKVK